MVTIYAMVIVWSVFVLTLLGLEAIYQIAKYLGVGKNVRTSLRLK